MARTTVDVYVLTPGATVWLALRMNVYQNLLSLVPVEILGVFLDENGAVAACTGPYDICGPVRFDHAYVADGEEWKGAYYPHTNKK